MYTGQDGDLSVACKKLFKKDPVTRVKALCEISGLLEDRGPDIFPDFISFFVYAYNRIILDNHRLIVEQLNSILMQLVNIHRPGFKPFMRELIGPWWVSTCDVYTKSAEIASAAFERAFPSQEQALQNFSSSILSTVRTNLSMTASDVDDAVDDAGEYLERIQAMSLSALQKFIVCLSREANVAVHQEGHYSAIFGGLPFWRETLSSSRPRIRRHAMELLTAVSLHAPFTIEGLLEGLTKLVSHSLHDAHLPNLSTAFDMLLRFSAQFPLFWSLISLEKHIFPVLLSHIKRDPSVALQYVLPLIGGIPETELFKSSNIERIESFVESIYEVVQAEHIRADIAGVYMAELCGYLVVRLISSSSSTDAMNAKNLCGLMLGFLRLLASHSHPSSSMREHVSRLGKVLGKLGQISDREGCSLREWLWDPLVELIKALADDATESAFVAVDFVISSLESSWELGSRKSGSQGLKEVFTGILRLAERSMCLQQNTFSHSLLWAFVISSLFPYAGPPTGCGESFVAGEWIRSSTMEGVNDQHLAEYYRRTLASLADVPGINDHKANIILNAVQSKDPVALVILLESDFMNNSPLGAESFGLLEETAASLLSPGSAGDSWPLSFQIRFLLSLSSASLNPRSSEFIASIRSWWRSARINACCWTLLSMAVNQHNFPNIIELEEVLHLIVSSFFGRVRDENRGSSRQTSLAFNEAKYAVITTWSDLKHHLLPTLGADGFRSLIDRICSELRVKLKSSKSLSDDEKDEGSESSGMQPRKIARHVCGVISLGYISPSLPSKAVLLHQIGLADPEIWSSDSIAVSFLLAILNGLLEFWEGDVAFIWDSFLDSANIFLVFLTKLRTTPFQSDSSTDGESLVARVFEALSSWEATRKENFLVELVNLIISNKVEKGEALLNEILTRSLNIADGVTRY